MLRKSPIKFIYIFGSISLARIARPMELCFQYFLVFLFLSTGKVKDFFHTENIISVNIKLYIAPGLYKTIKFTKIQLEIELLKWNIHFS